MFNQNALASQAFTICSLPSSSSQLQDAATIIKELEVEHPAAKLVILASQQQEHEAGDSTNLVIILAGKLLEKAETLLRMVSLSCLLRLFLFFLVCSVCSAYCCRFKAVKIAHKRIRMHMHTHV